MAFGRDRLLGWDAQVLDVATLATDALRMAFFGTVHYGFGNAQITTTMAAFIAMVMNHSKRRISIKVFACQLAFGQPVSCQASTLNDFCRPWRGFDRGGRVTQD